jgi:outer membrane protein
MKKLIVLTSALLATQANAADLNQIYQQALANDAELSAAKAQRDADGYQVGLARAALLPQVSVSYSQTENDVETEASAFSSETEYTTETSNLNATVSQTLFNLSSWYNYQAAAAGGEVAELQYTLAEQQLILRTAEAYFNVLRAQENLETAQAEEKAVKRQLEQTQQRYEVGLIAITEVHEAEASYDLAYANLIGQEAALDISYEALEQITGQRFDQLDQLKGDIAFAAPERRLMSG